MTRVEQRVQIELSARAFSNPFSAFLLVIFQTNDASRTKPWSRFWRHQKASHVHSSPLGLFLKSGKRLFRAITFIGCANPNWKSTNRWMVKFHLAEKKRIWTKGNNCLKGNHWYWMPCYDNGSFRHRERKQIA